MRPSVFSDGRGYYAYLRSPLIDHNLRFASDWNSPPQKVLYDCKSCPPSARKYWNHPANSLLFINLNGRIYENPITKTGHLPNFYTVGPAMLWLPFVGAAHFAVLASNHWGSAIPADGHSWPYVFALSMATAFYGFLGLYLAFQLAKKFVEERWAFWATLGIWFASSLPSSMYVQPSWSHTHSAFAVALFLWYWHRTRASRTWRQWLYLGLISGLMVDIYLANGIFLLAPGVDCVLAYARSWRDPRALWANLRLHLLFAASAIAAFSPMLITRQIVFGNPFTLGMYGNVAWNWTSPNFRAVLFSSKDGIFVCTPILLLAVLGLLALWRKNPSVGGICILLTTAFYALISFYPWWHGVYSFGNRFFISLTPIFVLGLAAAFSWAAQLWGDSRVAARRLVPVTVLLIVWNLGLVYQWSTYLFFPEGVGTVSWSEVLDNQIRVVPVQILHDLSSRFQFSHSAATSRVETRKSASL
ncbi:MAG TPA: hypothetical protein VG322_03175 [Candidatus Acidoferrales bacterium]|nr:hypothetical protein [Candidatus Acidoferrales bacterium]